MVISACWLGWDADVVAAAACLREKGDTFGLEWQDPMTILYYLMLWKLKRLLVA